MRWVILSALLTGCASLPDPANCEAYNVAIGRKNTGPMGCDIVEERPLPRRQVFERCSDKFACVRVTSIENGEHTCTIYWDEGDRWTLYHERCHVRWGVKHDDQPKTISELLMGWRERVRLAEVGR